MKLITPLVVLYILSGDVVLAQQALQQCVTRIENREGVAGDKITIDGTVGGITVLRPDSKRCSAIVYNSQTAGNVRCATDGVVPTATTGFSLEPGVGLVYHAKESLKGLKCIQEGGTAGSVSTVETLP